MFNIIKLLILFTLLMLMSGCVANRSFEEVKGSQKVFDKEDLYILIALRAEQLEDYNSSSNLFNTLYEKTNKKEYLYRSLKNGLAANENEKVVEKVDAVTKNNIDDDFELERIKIIAFINLNRLIEAKSSALKLVELSDMVDDYLLVSEIYVKLKKPDDALKYLEGAYVKNYNEKILDRMSIVLYVNLNRKKDAIAQLETHSRIHGCSKFICSRLIGFYSDENDIEGLLSVYLRLYKMDFDKEIAKKIVQIYGYKKDYIKMVAFLEESQSDNELLLQFYLQEKNYKKAFPLADKLYKESGDATYLGQSAIFEYESSDDKSDKTMQKSVIKKLQTVIEIKKDGIYLNYLGYLLIDNDIDVKKGIEHIKEALIIEPNSIYYLDSLAWGYYKLKECEKAKEIMDRVKDMDGSSNEEVVNHIEMIKKCKKDKKIE